MVRLVGFQIVDNKVINMSENSTGNDNIIYHTAPIVFEACFFTNERSKAHQDNSPLKPCRLRPTCFDVRLHKKQIKLFPLGFE